MDSVIESCPGCGRRLRIPILRGALNLTCPTCRQTWEWSPPGVITHFDPDPVRLAPLKACMAAMDGESSAFEWPGYLLSSKTIVYGSGRIARDGDAVRHEVAAAELALCVRLAHEARALLDGKVNGGLGTEGHLPFDAFWLAANRDEVPPARIDENLIRACFGGTIYPSATIDIQPLTEEAGWWSEVLMCAEETAEVEAMLHTDDEDDEDPAPYFEAFRSVWREMLRWFKENPEFVDVAYVAIGNYNRFRDHFCAMAEAGRKSPDGFDGIPSAYPRLFLGLTRGGSLAGIITHVVQT